MGNKINWAKNALHRICLLCQEHGWQTIFEVETNLTGFTLLRLKEGYRFPELGTAEAVLVHAVKVVTDFHYHQEGISFFVIPDPEIGFGVTDGNLLIGQFNMNGPISKVSRLPLVAEGYSIISPFSIHAFEAVNEIWAIGVVTPPIQQQNGTYDLVDVPSESVIIK